MPVLKLVTPAEAYKLTEADCRLLEAMTETMDPEVLADKLRIKMNTLARKVELIRERTGLPNQALPRLGRLILTRKCYEASQLSKLSDLIICASCGLPQKSDRFILYPDDLRCSQCISQETLSANNQRIAKAVADYLKKGIKRVKNSRPLIPAVEQVLNGVLERLGGADAFAGMWADTILKMKEKNPGSKMLADQCMALAKFHAEIEKMRGHDESIHAKTTDELESQMNSIRAEFVATHSEPFTAILQQIIIDLQNPDNLSDPVKLIEARLTATPLSGDVHETNDVGEDNEEAGAAQQDRD